MMEPLLSKNLVDVISKSYKSCYDFSITNNIFFPLIYIKSILFKKKISSLPFMDINYIDQILSKKDIEELIEKSEKNNVDLIELKLSTFQSSLNKNSDLLEGMNFIEEDHKHHYVIDIKNPELMWSAFHKHTRNDIRKAEKSDLKIKKIINKKEMKEFYKIYLKEMRRFGTPQHSYKFFENLKEIFEENFLGLNCYKERILIASIIMIYSKDFAYLWFNVSNPKFRNFRPNDILYWVLIKESFKRKIKKLDIGQIDVNPQDSREKSLSKFKQKWLGKPYRKKYFYYFLKEKENTKGKKDNLKKYRKIWRKLPSPIIRVIGSKVCSGLGI